MIALLAAISVAAGPAAAPASKTPDLAIVFHVEPPLSNDATLAAADVGLRAPLEIGEPLAALRAHPGARIAFAITPAYLDALERAAADGSALSDAARRKGLGRERTRELLAILARHRPLSSALAHTRFGARFLTLATSVANGLTGDYTTPFSTADIADFAGADAQVVLASSGSGHASGAATNAASVDALAEADGALIAALRTSVRAGQVELLGTPDGEPVLPLLIDAAGKSTTDRTIIDVGASSDGRTLVTAALRSVEDLAHSGGVGVYAPYGAYDDATGALFKQSGATYALFSDRVVRDAGGAGTQSGIEAASASAMRAVSLTVDRGVSLPVLFWNESDSADLQAVIGSDGAMAQRLVTLARMAAQLPPASTPGLLLLRIDADGSWAQRPDAPLVVSHLITMIASQDAGTSTTPGAFLRTHPATAPAYGYPAASEAGSFQLWMGTPDQASLWKALAAARSAAGGDAAMAKPAVRPLLVAAESGTWYAMLDSPLGSSTQRELQAFRSLIAAIYHAAGAQAPTTIAPVKADGAQPAPSPTILVAPTPGSSPKPPR